VILETLVKVFREEGRNNDITLPCSDGPESWEDWYKNLRIFYLPFVLYLFVLHHFAHLHSSPILYYKISPLFAIMKAVVPIFALAALFASQATAHTTLQWFWPNSSSSTQACVRQPPNNNPVQDVTSAVCQPHSPSFSSIQY
jgi:hypothetical protein